MNATDYKFGGVWVNTIPERRWMQTVFPDGSKLVATPDPPGYYAEMAQRLGYGSRGKADDIWRCCFEHETFHTITAQIYGLDYSPTLWKAAHETGNIPFPRNTPVPNAAQCAAEESLILSLQAYLNGAGKFTEDIGYLVDSAGITRGYLKREFAERLRNARADAREWQGARAAQSFATGADTP